MKYIVKKTIVPLKKASGSISDTLNVEDKITNAPSINLMLNTIFPIGRGFIDFTDTDYSNYLGFTWERELVGMSPIGLDIEDEDFNEVGKTGGSKTHKLTVSEIPSHKHGVAIGNAKCDLTLETNNNTITSPYGYGTTNANYTTSTGYQTSSSGSGQEHNNLHPYKVVSYWKRIA